MNKKQTINWLVGIVLVGVLMGGLSATVSANLLDSRYHISGYVGSNKTNDSNMFIQKSSGNTVFDFTNLAQYGLDVGVRIGDTPWAFSAGYFSVTGVHKYNESYSYETDFIQHRLGGRWIHKYSDHFSIYLGAGLSKYNVTRVLNTGGYSTLGSTTRSFSVNQLGLYSEIAGIVSITDRLYTGAKIDYSFSNATGHELSAISYGIVAGVSF